MSRKSTDCDGGKCVTNGIENGHSCKEIGSSAGNGEQQIDAKERFGGAGDAGR